MGKFNYGGTTVSDQTVLNEMAIKQVLKGVHAMYIKQQIMLLNALKTEYGKEVVDIVRETNSGMVCQTFRDQAVQSGKNSIEDLVAVLWEPLRSKGYAFTMEAMDGGIKMNCTACPFASMYKAMGGEDWGYALYCAADEDLARAFNPNIGFKREHTLMEGHTCCDHFYYYLD